MLQSEYFTLLLYHSHHVPMVASEEDETGKKPNRLRACIVSYPAGCREGDMAAVVFGTSQRSGPGFTSDEIWLNVMIQAKVGVTTVRADGGDGAAGGQGR
jgi:hypothetical protein